MIPTTSSSDTPLTVPSCYDNSRDMNKVETCILWLMDDPHLELHRIFHYSEAQWIALNLSQQSLAPPRSRHLHPIDRMQKSCGFLAFNTLYNCFCLHIPSSISSFMALILLAVLCVLFFLAQSKIDPYLPSSIRAYATDHFILFPLIMALIINFIISSLLGL